MKDLPLHTPARWLLMAATCLLMPSCMEEPKDAVYLCSSPGAQCYHNDRQCEGLQQCGSYIRTVTRQRAEEIGRRPCTFCYESESGGTP